MVNEGGLRRRRCTFEEFANGLRIIILCLSLQWLQRERLWQDAHF